MSRSAPDPSARPWRPAEIVVGRIGRAHGLDGSVHLDGHGGAVPLAPGTAVTVGGRAARVLGRRGTDERPILRFDLAADREAAEALRGQPVTVPAERLPEPDADEYFHVDLEGCAVVAGERRLGEVARVLEYPANDVLEVRDAEGRELLIPFAADVVLEVDVPGRRIAVREDFL
jgi:16S rRNA processing protein RimM